VLGGYSTDDTSAHAQYTSLPSSTCLGGESFSVKVWWSTSPSALGKFCSEKGHDFKEKIVISLVSHLHASHSWSSKKFSFFPNY